MATHQQIVDFIIKNAPGLREAGVLSLAMEGTTVQLAPYEPMQQMADAKPVDDPVIEHSDPLMDPDTYPGGKVPTYRAPQDDEQT